MKKLLLTTTDSDTHTQKFNLGTTAFDINNAIAIENIQDSGLIYNAMVLAQGEYVGSLGSRVKGLSTVDEGDFNGTSIVTAGRTKFDISSTPFIDGISGTPTLHYVGTMPNFDFPFPEE